MCGRASLPDDVSELKQDLRIEWDKLGDYRPRWNAAPTSDLPVVTSSPDRGRTLEVMRWGLIPSWAKDSKIARSTFNARAEGIGSKPAFRNAWKAARRCLVVADGYYEWRQNDKQPFAMALGNRGLMTFAGLWDLWKATDGATIKSFTIITTRANDLAASIHDRMPVILPSGAYASWLNPTMRNSRISLARMVPYAGPMRRYPVSTRINQVQNDDVECAKRVELGAPPQGSLFL